MFFYNPLSTLSIHSVKIILLAGILALSQVDCGAVYPDDDSFKNYYPGTLGYYYFTNTTYRLTSDSGSSIPIMSSSSRDDVLFFLINQRDDVYYNKGFQVDFKKYDTRWFLQVENPLNTNYFFFSNAEFNQDISFHYYELGGNAVKFTNGYLLVTQADPLNWYVEAQVEQDGVSRSGSAFHRLAEYNSDNETFPLVE